MRISIVTLIVLAFNTIVMAGQEPVRESRPTIFPRYSSPTNRLPSPVAPRQHNLNCLPMLKSVPKYARRLTPEQQKLFHVKEAIRHLKEAGFQDEVTQLESKAKELQQLQMKRELKQKEEQLQRLQKEIEQLREQVGDTKASAQSDKLPEAYFLRDDIQFFPPSPPAQLLKRAYRAIGKVRQLPKPPKKTEAGIPELISVPDGVIPASKDIHIDIVPLRQPPQAQPVPVPLPEKDAKPQTSSASKKQQVVVKMKVLSYEPEKFKKLRIEFSSIGNAAPPVASIFNSRDKQGVLGKGNMVVICRAPDEVRWNFHDIDHEIANYVTAHLNSQNVKCIESNRVRDWRDQHEEDGIGSIAKDLNANHLLLIEIDRFTLYEPKSGTLFRGNASGHVTLKRIGSDGKTQELTRKRIKSTFPILQPVSNDGTTYAKFKRNYLGNLAESICQSLKSAPANSNANVKIIADSESVSKFVDALQKHNLVKTIAEPSLVTTSGRPASFRSGGEFPIPVVQDDKSVSIEYRDFGVSLDGARRGSHSLGTDARNRRFGFLENGPGRRVGNPIADDEPSQYTSRDEVGPNLGA